MTNLEIAPGLDNLENEPGCERESADGGGADSVIRVSAHRHSRRRSVALRSMVVEEQVKAGKATVVE